MVQILIVASKKFISSIIFSVHFFPFFSGYQVQRLALFAVGNLAFCLENRRILSQSESLRELLLRLTVTTEPRVSKAAARALAILGVLFLFHYIPFLQYILFSMFLA